MALSMATPGSKPFAALRGQQAFRVPRSAATTVRVYVAGFDEAGGVVHGLAADEGGGTVSLSLIFEEGVENSAGGTSASHRRGKAELAQGTMQVGANGNNCQPLTVLAGAEMASLQHLVMSHVARGS
jgi:hypothetical protein